MYVKTELIISYVEDQIHQVVTFHAVNQIIVICINNNTTQGVLIGYRLLIIINKQRREDYSIILKGVRDGLGLSTIIKERVGILDLEKTPHIHVNTIDALLELLQIKKIGR